MAFPNTLEHFFFNRFADPRSIASLFELEKHQSLGSLVSRCSHFDLAIGLTIQEVIPIELLARLFEVLVHAALGDAGYLVIQ